HSSAHTLMWDLTHSRQGSKRFRDSPSPYFLPSEPPPPPTPLTYTHTHTHTPVIDTTLHFVSCDLSFPHGPEWESREPVLHGNRGCDGGLLPEPQISATLRPHSPLTCNQSCSQVCVFHIHIHYSHSRDDRGATVVQEVEKSVSNQNGC